MKIKKLKSMKKRFLSLLLCAVMLCGFVPQGTMAASASTGGDVCAHHVEHTEDCGYSKGVEGSLCTHEHAEDCTIFETNCVHSHDESCYPNETVLDDSTTPSKAGEASPTECTHVCGEESACTTKKLNCTHSHDENCGYVEAVEGTPCNYDCPLCSELDNEIEEFSLRSEEVTDFATLKETIEELTSGSTETISVNAEKIAFDSTITVPAGVEVTLSFSQVTIFEPNQKDLSSLFFIPEEAGLTIGETTTDAYRSTWRGYSGNAGYMQEALIESKGDLILNSGIIGDWASSKAVIALDGDKSLFVMNGGQIGSSDYYWPDCAVKLDNGANLNLNDGVITGSAKIGVHADHQSMFTMEGGLIEKAKDKGVLVDHGSAFTMNDGEISENGLSEIWWMDAGGVNVFDGSSFTMNGGEISYNKGGTGGVCIGNNVDTMQNAYKDLDVLPSNTPAIATFIFNDGYIGSNTGYDKGGGLFVSANADVTMNGGSLSENTTEVGGGGVLIQDGYLLKYAGNEKKPVTADDYPKVSMSEWQTRFPGRFTMNGGSISRNEALGKYTQGGSAAPMDVDGDGGGILIWSNEVYLKAGEIAHNTAKNHGGGVHVKTVPYHLSLSRVEIRTNKASNEGGGLWFCPIGISDIYFEEGALVTGNTAVNAGDDFYTVEKRKDTFTTSLGGQQSQVNGILYMSDKTLGGGKVHWYADNHGDRYIAGTTPEEDVTSIYNRTNAYGLKSQLEQKDIDTAEQLVSLIVVDNQAESGGGISANGWITIGKGPQPIQVTLSGEKHLLDFEGTQFNFSDEVFRFKLTDTNLPGTLGYSLSKTTSSSEVIPSSEPKIGAFSFDINFSLPGTYTFDVTEIKGDDEAYQYDNAKYHIEYKITLNADNVLQESHTIKKETLQPTQSTTEVDKIVFENVHAPKTSVQVTKVWNDNNNQDGKRPESVTIKLLADGKVVEGKTLTLTAANNWTGTFSDLDGYKAGKKIAYTVEEITISNGYEVSVTGTAADGYTVTNTYHAPKMGGITIEKEVTDTIS